MTKTELSFYCERLNAEIKHLQSLHTLLLVAAQDDNLEEPYIDSIAQKIIADVEDVGFALSLKISPKKEEQQAAENVEAPF